LTIQAVDLQYLNYGNYKLSKMKRNFKEKKIAIKFVQKLKTLTSRHEWVFNTFFSTVFGVSAYKQEELSQ
jgi:hypothetical protein